MEKILFLDTGTNTGKFNMAVDYYLARNFSEYPVFRVYRWDPYCISLGYHQKLEEIDVKRCIERDFDIVRRETGGRAVFHSEELTYSMTIPKSSSLYSDSILEVYNRISTVLVKALQKTGVEEAVLQKGKVPDFKNLYKDKLSSICFSSTSTYEVVLREKKLVGSAQKRLKDSVLQHGSILVGKKHLELIDLLNISDKMKERFYKMTQNKTISVSEVKNISDADMYISELTIALFASLEAEFGMKIEEFSFNNKDLLEISEIESYFELEQ